MDILTIKAETNEDFVIALASPSYSDIIDFTQGRFRAQLRRTAGATLPVTEWTSDAGNIWWSPTYKVLTIWSQLKDINALGLTGVYQIGCRFEMLGFFYNVFEGTVDFSTGIVRP